MRRVLQWATNVAVAISTLPREAVASESASASLAPDSVPTTHEQHPEWSTTERLRRFGPHDPVFDAALLLWPCLCGGTAAITHPRGLDSPVPDPQLHVVRCPDCGNSSASWPSTWQAVTSWNQANPHKGLALEQFPFFEMAGLSQHQARTKLLGVRAELESRRLSIHRRLQAGQEVSRRYRERVDAYLRWTMVAHALAKAQAQAQAQQARIRRAAPGLAGRGGT